jgi:hypothetical protein
MGRFGYALILSLIAHVLLALVLYERGAISAIQYHRPRNNIPDLQVSLEVRHRDPAQQSQSADTALLPVQQPALPSQKKPDVQVVTVSKPLPDTGHANVSGDVKEATNGHAVTSGSERHDKIDSEEASPQHDQNILPMPSKKAYPPNLLVFVINIGVDGTLLDFKKVSRADANSVLYVMMVAKIKAMKFEPDDQVRTLVVTGPPLTIESDPEMISQYLPQTP